MMTVAAAPYAYCEADSIFYRYLLESTRLN